MRLGVRCAFGGDRGALSSPRGLPVTCSLTVSFYRWEKMGQIAIVFTTQFLLEVPEEASKHVNSFPIVYRGNMFARVTHEQV